MSEPTASPREPLPLRLRRELYRRTGGRVTGLEVRQDGDDILVSGKVPSPQVKVLVILAALTALRPKEGQNVVLELCVEAAPPLAEGSGCDGAWDGPVGASLPEC
jgi:hypothetical protein